MRMSSVLPAVRFLAWFIIGDLMKLRRRRQRERQKSNTFNVQNNNSARAKHEEISCRS